WLVVTPEGLFDGSDGGRQKVAFRIGNELDVLPVDYFFNDFYRAGLLASLWQGERPRPRPGIELGKRRPPTVRSPSPSNEGPVEKDRVTLEVEARDEGGGIQGPWLIHNGARLHVRDAERERRDRAVRCRFPVELVEGENRLEVLAAAEDGSPESEPAVLTL